MQWFNSLETNHQYLLMLAIGGLLAHPIFILTRAIYNTVTSHFKWVIDTRVVDVIKDSGFYIRQINIKTFEGERTLEDHIINLTIKAKKQEKLIRRLIEHQNRWAVDPKHLFVEDDGMPSPGEIVLPNFNRP